MRDPELAALFQLHLARLETAFAAALTRARSAGFLVAVVQGMNVLVKTRPQRRTLEGIAQVAVVGLALPSPWYAGGSRC